MPDRASTVAPPIGPPLRAPRRPPRRPPAAPDDGLAVARRAIAAAEAEVRDVLAAARTQLAEIGVRTREALELLPATGFADDATAVAAGPPSPVGAASPDGGPPPLGAPSPMVAAGGWAEDHVYAGTVSVTCGPFSGIDQLAAFERALESVDGVAEVYTRSFAGNDVHLDITLARPTVLLTQLKRATATPLTVVEGGDRHVRLRLGDSPQIL